MTIRNTADCSQMTNMWKDIIEEIKIGPSVFIHGPEFWLLFPWLLLVAFIIIMIGGKRK